MYILDVVNDVVQIGTFIVNKHWWFAGFMILFIVLSLGMTLISIVERSKFNTFAPLREIRRSLARGVATESFNIVFHIERMIEAPSTGLIGPYGASLLPLTPLQACSALYGLLSSAKVMAEGRLAMEVLNGTNAEPYAFKAVRPVKAALFTAWYFCAFAGELAAFAVVSATLHPCATLPGYLLGAAADGVAAVWGGLPVAKALGTTALSMIAVPCAMAGTQTKSFFGSNDPPGPGAIPATFIFARFFAWAALCCLDLPQGILPVGSLGRPMGLTVLRQNFLEPVAACQEALACLSSHTGVSLNAEANTTSIFIREELGFGPCCWPAAGELNTASTIFNSCLLFLAVVLVPMHMCLVTAMLFLNPTYAFQVDNVELREEVKKKNREISKFAARNEQAAGEHTELSPLPT